MVDAQPAQLGADRRDVGLGGDPRVLPGLDGVLLGGQAEGVVAHRVQDVVAVHPPEPAGDVGAQVAQRVADVQPRARGVREHVHHEELGPVGDPLEARRSAGRPGSACGTCPRPPSGPASASSICWASAGRVAVRRDVTARLLDVRLVGGLAHRACSRSSRTGGGHQKTPHAGGVAVLSERFRSARPGKQEPPGHGAEPTATRPDRAPQVRLAGLTRTGRRSLPVRLQPTGHRPMNDR